MVVERDEQGTVIVDGVVTRYSVGGGDQWICNVFRDGDKWESAERTANQAMLTAARLHLIVDVQEVSE